MALWSIEKTQNSKFEGSLDYLYQRLCLNNLVEVLRLPLLLLLKGLFNSYLFLFLLVVSIRLNQHSLARIRGGNHLQRIRRNPEIGIHDFCPRIFKINNIEGQQKLEFLLLMIIIIMSSLLSIIFDWPVRPRTAITPPAI